MKNVAFFDLDKTVYNGYSMLDFLLGYVVPQRKISLRHFLESLVLILGYKLGFIAHNRASNITMEITAKVLKGRTVAEVAAWPKGFFSVKKFFPHIPKLFELLRKNDFEIYIVSASVEPTVKACAELLNAKSFYSTLEVKDGMYTGKIASVMNAQTKADSAEQVLKTKKPTGMSIAFGDASGDYEMLSKADHGFLLEPREKEFAAKAQSEGIHIVTQHNCIAKVKEIISK